MTLQAFKWLLRTEYFIPIHFQYPICSKAEKERIFFFFLLFQLLSSGCFANGQISSDAHGHILTDFTLRSVSVDGVVCIISSGISLHHFGGTLRYPLFTFL